MKRKGFFTKLSQTGSILLTAAFLLAAFPADAAAAETPDATYTGISNAAAVLGNLVYSDINPKVWSNEAVYESGALGIVKGYGNQSFGRSVAVSREEALAIAYRAAGREAEAQLAGEGINAARTAANRKTNTQQVWYDGYLQLALNDGLITRQDYNDAMNTDQTSLAPESFHRSAAAQRQEMAYWLAGTLKISPVRGQQNIFNNYIDWKSADPAKVPAIEAMLENSIMSGEGARFSPTGTLTREQAAQIIKNAEAFMLPILKLDKLTGTIEAVAASKDNSGSKGLADRTYAVRNSSGKLHAIKTSSPADTSGNPRNEQQGNTLTAGVKELPVYKNGAMGNSSLLKKGDRVEYIVDTADNSVKYVKVISNTGDVRYVAAQISGIDTANLLLNVLQLFNVDYPDIKTLNQNVKFSTGADATNTSYRYSKSAAVTVNGKSAAISDLSPDMTVILTIMNNNVVSAIQSADFNVNSEESRIVKGIVEENNPQLGYITLYNADGSSGGKTSTGKLAALRTYNYLNPNKVEVLKNHKTAGIEKVEAGDTAYLKLDEDGNVVSVSAVENYYVKYGKIISKSAGEIAVQYDDGDQQLLDVKDSVLVIRDGSMDSYSSLRDGDRVRLQMNITEKGIDLKEITIEGDEHFISNIYKGEAFVIDDMASKISVLNMQVLNRGKWEYTDKKGFTGIPMAEDCKMYYNGSEIDVEDAAKLLSNNQAYIAAEKDYGGAEKAVLLSFRNKSDAEVLYNDSIAGVTSGSGSFSLNTAYQNVKYGTGSIIVKNGRLVAPGSLTVKDKALVVANRDSASGIFNAGVVKIDDQTNLINGQLYRARIKAINPNSSFTVESFSQLNGTDWTYANTPKTFQLNFSTRLLDDDGVADLREFVGYGENSYLGRTVYVLADDTNALVISTAPYGIYNARGIVYSLRGVEYGDEGTLLSEPDEILLRSVQGYNSTNYTWEAVKDMDLGIPANSLIFKNGNIVKPSDIKEGDTVRVIKKEAGETGTAFIIMVE